MSLTYNKIKNSPKNFQQLFGLTPEQFNEISSKAKKVFEKIIIAKYKRQGRFHKLSFEDMLLLLLLYYRTYMTQRFVAILFNIDVSRVCRIIKMLEPILLSVVKIKKTKHLSKEEVDTLIVDATEQQIERPKYNQKPYYSGKKKRHTLKTEIRTTREGRIVYVSKAIPGSVHDLVLYRKQKAIPKKTTIYGDSGYQGLQHQHKKIVLPHKAKKKTPLTEVQKAFNKAYARTRVVVENIFGDMKVFKILDFKYRNKGKGYDTKFKLIAGFINLKNGFGIA